MTDGEDMDRAELEARVIYALFLPVARVAAGLEAPLAELKKRLEVAYFHETRRRGLSLKDAMRTMSVSISKAAGLSRALKDNFSVAADRTHGLPRRVEYVLWAEPLTRKRLGQALKGVEDSALDEALERLVSEGRVRLVARDGRQDPVYALVTRGARRVWNDWLARFDGLDNALDSVTRAVRARFFDADERALARTVTFHAREQDLAALHTFYEETLFPFLASLDEAATSPERGDEESTRTVSLSVFWSSEPTGPGAHADEDDP